jgi:hypothetical protein
VNCTAAACVIPASFSVGSTRAPSARSADVATPISTPEAPEAGKSIIRFFLLCVIGRKQQNGTSVFFTAPAVSDDLAAGNKGKMIGGTASNMPSRHHTPVAMSIPSGCSQIVVGHRVSRIRQRVKAEMFHATRKDRRRRTPGFINGSTTRKNT